MGHRQSVAVFHKIIQAYLCQFAAGPGCVIYWNGIIGVLQNRECLFPPVCSGIGISLLGYRIEK